MNEISRDAMAGYERLLNCDRPLYAPLRTLPACSGNCSQGRRPCVTPEACVLPEDAEPVPWLTRSLFWCGYCAVVVLALLGVHGWRAGWFA